MIFWDFLSNQSPNTNSALEDNHSEVDDDMKKEKETQKTWKSWCEDKERSKKQSVLRRMCESKEKKKRESVLLMIE